MKSKKKNWKAPILHSSYACIISLLIIVILNIVSISENAFSSTMRTLLSEGNTIVLSIVCSILASIIYSIITMRKSNEDHEIMIDDIERVAKKVYGDLSEDGINRITSSFQDSINTTNDMMPTRSYRSANSPNREFNAYLNSKIANSSIFIYYGESARFTCKRLYQLKKDEPGIVNLKVEIFVVDPSIPELFESNKAFLEVKEQNRPNQKLREWDTIFLEEKMKVLYCLYALYTMKRSFNSVDIYLVNDIPFLDIEMTDDTIILEFFRTRTDYKRYPLTIVYDSKKTYYESYQFYLDWEKRKAKHIDQETLSLEYILSLGAAAGIPNLTEDTLRTYCSEHVFSENERYI